MAGMTYNMITSGPDAGTVIRPLTYTTTEDEATNVKLWTKLATRLGSYRLATNEGLAHRRMLLSTTTDTERAALVRDLIVSDERVGSVDPVNVVADMANLILTVEATYTTITGATDTIGLNIGA